MNLIDVDHDVYVKPSTIPGAGNGLFAGKDFKKNELIVPYTGEILNKQQFEERYPEGGSEYVFEVNPNHFVDAVDWRRSSLGRYANRKPWSKANAKFTVNRKTNEVRIVAQKKIKKDDEIFLDYGPIFKPGIKSQKGLKTKRRSKKSVKYHYYEGKKYPLPSPIPKV